MKKHLINSAAGIGFASLFMFLTLRNKPMGEIFSLLAEARTGWILSSIVFLSLIFLFRTLRWQLFLNNNHENAPLKHVAYSLLLGTFVNAFTPKLGEVIRCTSLEKSTGISTSKAMGTVISDRIWDLVVLFSGVIIILLFEFEKLGSLVVEAFKTMFSSFGNNITGILIIILIIVSVILSAWYLAKRFGLSEKIRIFWKGVISTARKTFRIKRSQTFALYTLLIWILMILMNYACLRALPSTDNLSLYFAAVALFIGTLGWAIPSPAGIGTSHFFVLQLFILFGLSKESGVAYGLLINGVQVIITLGSGVLMLTAVYIYRIIKPLPESESEQ